MEALEFARSEAAGLGSVEFRIEPQPFDGYQIARQDGGYRVTGTNARSCLHAVYHLQAGRPAGRFRAAFAIRGINTCESLPCHTPEQLRRLIDRMGRWRMNTLVVHVNYGWKQHRDLITAECARRGIELVFYTYTSIVFLPPDAPADWLARDERGQPTTTRPLCESRLCLAQPAGLAAFEAGAERYFRDSVGPASGVLAMTGDGFGHCRCPHCRDLSPVEQWQPLLKRFIQAGRSLAPDKHLETILYVQRYAMPRQPDTMLSLDRMMFDLHQRCRWRPLGEAHSPVGNREAEVDPRAAGAPLNVYLLDRLAEWRSRFSGKLYCFENLCVHAAMSCPQPNTGVLLEDLRRLHSMGVDGMIYELLVGIDSFTSQLDTLADGLWDPEGARHTPSPVEEWCRRDCPAGAILFFQGRDFPWDRFADHWDPVLREHMANLRTYLASGSPASLLRVFDHLYAHPLRFHRQFIAFWMLQRLVASGNDDWLTEDERAFLATMKLWDYMEPLADPIAQTDALLRRIVGKLRSRI